MTPSYTNARQAIFRYFASKYGITLKPEDLSALEQMSKDLVAASEDAAMIMDGRLCDRHRLDRMEAARLSVAFSNGPSASHREWVAHTERTGWWVKGETLRQTIDSALTSIGSAE